MIEYLKTGSAGSVERLEAPETGCWVNVVAPTPEELELLERELGVLPEFVRSALDEEETSRIDYDDDAHQISSSSLTTRSLTRTAPRRAPRCRSSTTRCPSR